MTGSMWKNATYLSKAKTLKKIGEMLGGGRNGDVGMRPGGGGEEGGINVEHWVTALCNILCYCLKQICDNIAFWIMPVVFSVYDGIKKYE